METKIVYFKGPEKPPTREEIAALFAKLGADSPLTLALRTIIMERTADVMGAIADSRLTPDQRTHASGRLEELMSLHHEVQGMIMGVVK